MKLVLASASASRARLLSSAGVKFEISPAALDEDAAMQRLHAQGASPAAVAASLAAEKADLVSRRHPGALVLGGDTVVALGEDPIGKCPDIAAAEALLRRLCGREHLLVSAVSLVRDGVPVFNCASPVRLVMRRFSEAFLADYLAAEADELLATVGCYRFEGRGAQLFESVQGDYFSVLGLPLLPLLAALRKEGVLPS